jgi:hypothetical protein
MDGGEMIYVLEEKLSLHFTLGLVLGRLGSPTPSQAYELTSGLALKPGIGSLGMVYLPGPGSPAACCAAS